MRRSFGKGEVLHVQREQTEESLKSLRSTKSYEHNLDDILIVQDLPDVFPEDLSGLPPHRQSKEDHKVHLKLILELLKKEKLYAKLSKCEFYLQEVHFLGHVVDNNGIHMDPSKTEELKNLKAHKSPLEIHSFLGLSTSGAELEEAFQTLKDNLCNAPILTLLDGPDEFVVIVMRQIKDLDVCLCKGSEAYKAENTPAEMLRGLDQQMEKKENNELSLCIEIGAIGKS
ncbi:hypothetical protein Tco_0945544 [Tanacetum coccineum]